MWWVASVVNSDLFSVWQMQHLGSRLHQILLLTFVIQHPFWIHVPRHWPNPILLPERAKLINFLWRAESPLWRRLPQMFYSEGLNQRQCSVGTLTVQDRCRQCSFHYPILASQVLNELLGSHYCPPSNSTPYFAGVGSSILFSIWPYLDSDKLLPLQ